MRRRLAAALAAGLALASPGSAQQPASLDSILEEVRARADLPALAGAIVQRGEIVAIGAVGLRALGSSERVGLDDHWHIGSDTKAMTATLIARLVERGLLDWETTIGDVYPELADSVAPAWLDVTLWQLITHRSGLPDDRRPDNYVFPRLRTLDGTIAEQRRQVVSLLLSREPATPPGSTMAYSNFGYVLAGAMAERVAGGAWEDLLREHVLEPLGMTSVGFGAPGAGDSAVSEPRGHRGRQPIPPGVFSDNPPVLGPAGTLHTTIGDWARFVAAHASEGRHDDGEFLDSASWQRLHTPSEGSDYAGGWGVVPRGWSNGPALTHAGSNGLWFAVAWVAPGRDLAFVVATNVGPPTAPPAADAAVVAMLRWVEAHANDEAD